MITLYNQYMNNKEAAAIRKQALKESNVKIRSLNIKIKKLEGSQEDKANKFLQELYYEIFT